MSASRDQNYIPTKLAILNTDGRTIISLAVNPVNHALKVSDGTTGSNRGPTNALRDENNVPTIMGVSSSDFSTPTTIYANVNGALMVQST